MGEIKQTNFRIDSERADAFRAFCEENGLNQAQGFDHIMDVLAMNQAKETVSGRIVEIEEFERHAKALIAAYLNSIELAQNTEVRVKEDFRSMLQSKDEQILDLQNKLVSKNEDITALQGQLSDADLLKGIAEEQAKNARERMEAAEKTARDKESIADMLTVKLTEAESKLGEYPKMKETESYLRDELAKALQIIKDNQKDAEIAQERAVTAVYQEMGKALADADKEKNTAVSQLQAELAGVKASVAEKEKQVSKLEEKNEKLQEIIADLRAKNAQLESQNKEKE